jgi:hypothetical protein
VSKNPLIKHHLKEGKKKKKQKRETDIGRSKEKILTAIRSSDSLGQSPKKTSLIKLQTREEPGSKEPSPEEE